MNKVLLSDAATVFMGQSPPSSTYNMTGQGLPFFQGKADFSDLYPRIRTYCTKPTRIADAGDILISIRAPVGPTNLCPVKSCIGRGLAAIRPRLNTDQKYLLYFLRFHETALAAEGQGSTFDAISRDDLEAVSVPLPPLPEQRRLATLIDKADHLRRTRRYAQQLSDTFLQSVFLEMFGDLSVNTAGYDTASFEDVVAASKIGLVRGSEEMNAGHPYAYVRMDAIIGDGTLHLDHLRRVKATPKEVAENSLQPGDFLFNTRNSRELVGKTALFTIPGVFLFNNNILQVKFKKTVAPEYMMGLFQTHWAKQNLEKIKSGTTSVFAIYYKDLKDLPVVLPPLPLQEQFAQIVRRVERLRAQHREAARQAEHLFQTLLHRAFRGEI